MLVHYVVHLLGDLADKVYLVWDGRITTLQPVKLLLNILSHLIHYLDLSNKTFFQVTAAS